jgi:spectrin beta
MLHTLLQNCEKLQDWIQERTVLIQEDTYRSARTIHSKRTRHQAFASEIHSNKERLDKVQQSRHALLAAKPEMAELVGLRMDELTGQFDRLEEDEEASGCSTRSARICTTRAAMTSTASRGPSRPKSRRSRWRS